MTTGRINQVASLTPYNRGSSTNNRCFGQTLPFVRVKEIATRSQALLQSLVLLSHHHRTDGALTTLRVCCLLTALRVLPFQHKDFRSDSPFLFRPPHDVLFPRHLFQSPQFHTQVQSHTVFTELASRQTLQFHRTVNCPNVRSCRETLVPKNRQQQPHRTRRLIGQLLRNAQQLTNTPLLQPALLVQTAACSSSHTTMVLPTPVVTGFRWLTH
mmetsp:Transcript_21376/g.31807  ORF Transcript_21376/g.31807 Transcript_21376/m.31807 type:complete len:213 (-) Transcript_21376:100-738(-)